MKQTKVMLFRNPIRDRDHDIHIFSTVLTVEEIEKLIGIAERRKAEGRPLTQKRLATSEQIIGDIKMHRFERSGSCQEKSNATTADSCGK